MKTIITTLAVVLGLVLSHGLTAWFAFDYGKNRYYETFAEQEHTFYKDTMDDTVGIALERDTPAWSYGKDVIVFTSFDYKYAEDKIPVRRQLICYDSANHLRMQAALIEGEVARKTKSRCPTL
jgi:hypothetical protein